MSKEKKERIVTFKDFEVRYENLRKQFPKIKKCSVAGCENPRDVTELGLDTCCAYHRLLFDYWLYEVVQGDIMSMTQKGRRRAFTNWRHRLGKNECDEIVLKMAQEGINWVC